MWCGLQDLLALRLSIRTTSLSNSEGTKLSLVTGKILISGFLVHVEKSESMYPSALVTYVARTLSSGELIKNRQTRLPIGLLGK